MNELHVMMAEIGYEESIPTYFHFKYPGKDLDVGLHALGGDADVLEMLKLVTDYRFFEIYTEDWETKLNTYYMSPGGSKVFIEELPDEVSHEFNGCKVLSGLPSSCQKKLLLGWTDEDNDKELGDLNKSDEEVLERKGGGSNQRDETADDIAKAIENDEFDPFLGDEYIHLDRNVGTVQGHMRLREMMVQMMI